MQALISPEQWALRSFRSSGGRAALLLVVILTGLQVWLTVLGARDPALFLGAIAFLAVCAASFQNTTAGLAFIILFQFRVLKGTEDISIEEIVYAALFLSTLAGWWLRKAPLEVGRRILRSPLARSMILFLAICVMSIVPNVLFGGQPLWWFRDLVRFSYLLLFFPVADVARTRHGPGVILGCLLSVILVHGALAVHAYSQMIRATEALWMLKYQRATLHEVFYMATFVVCFALFLYTRSKRVMALAVLLSLVSLTSLVVSLTRGYWLATAVASLVVILLTRRSVSRAAVFALIVIALVGLAGYAMFQGRFLGLLSTLAHRVSTFTAPLTVLSMQHRAAEADAVLDQIRLSPIIGQGLGAQFSYMSPIRHRVITGAYVHNAYLFIWYKLGLLGLIAFFSFYLRGIGRVISSLREEEGRNMKAILVASVGLLVAFMPLSLTSPQYYGKSSALIISLILGVAEAVAQGRARSQRASGVRPLDP